MNDHAIADDAFTTELVALVPQIRAFARSLCNDAVHGEDLAQEAFAKALAARASFEMGTNMRAWAFMIVRNLFYSETRRSWRSVAMEPDFAERALVVSENPTARLELDEVRRAMALLPDVQREALILIGAAGLSYEEVGEISGVAVGTVKSRVSRARTALAAILAGGKIPEDDEAPESAMAAILGDVERCRTGVRQAA